jgi:hypothetical protein
MKRSFDAIRKRLGTSGGKVNVAFVNGCCYGIDRSPDKVQYQKLCGQSFWEFISGDKDLYVNIIEPLGTDALQRNQEFAESYAKIINRFTKEFTDDFCDDEGAIDWEKLVKFNSGPPEPKIPKVKAVKKQKVIVREKKGI